MWFQIYLTWGIWWIFTQPLKSPKISLRWAILSKVYEVWAKKIQKSYLSWHWSVIQNLKNPDLVVSKMAWGIWRTSIIRAPRSLKIVHWWALFVQNIYCFSLKLSEKLYYVSWQWKVLQSLNENWLVGWKMI